MFLFVALAHRHHQWNQLLFAFIGATVKLVSQTDHRIYIDICQFVGRGDGDHWRRLSKWWIVNSIDKLCQKLCSSRKCKWSTSFGARWSPERPSEFTVQVQHMYRTAIWHLTRAIHGNEHTWCQTVFDGRHLIDAECRRWSQFQNGEELEVHAIFFIRFWVRIHHSLHSLFLNRSTFRREKLLDLDRIDCRCTRENETKNETVKQRMKGKEYDLWRENNIGANAQTKHQSPTIAITTSATTAIVSMENGQS